MSTTEIGIWHERESREIRQCPSYYAADWEILQTEPGDYPVTIDDRYLHVAIPARRIDGATYSGFAGVNFASRALPVEPKPYLVQAYDYSLPEFIDSGTVSLSPDGAAFMADRIASWREMHSRLARERAERESFMDSLSVYLRMRASRFSHSYSFDLSVRQYGITPDAAEIETGERLARAAHETMGDRHPIRHAALVAALSA